MRAELGRIPFWRVNAVSLAYLMASAVFVPPLVYLEVMHCNGSSTEYYNVKTLSLVINIHL